MDHYKYILRIELVLTILDLYAALSVLVKKSPLLVGCETSTHIFYVRAGIYA